MTKKSLVLLITEAALRECSCHVRRLAVLQQLADKDSLPVRFLGSKNVYYYLLSVGKVDLMYEDQGENHWFIKLI